MSTATAVVELRDVESLYRRLAPRLERIVGSGVLAPDVLIEDACQTAWARLVDRSERIQRETVLGWLTVTALHEAWRLQRRRLDEPSLEAMIEAAAELPTAHYGPSPQELMERRIRLERVNRLAARQQRLVWLHAFGFSYAEMAAHERCTTRTVDRDLSRAREMLRKG